MSAAPFEARYRADADPWRTLSDPAERAKAAHVLAVCGDGPFAAALELGCGIGALTADLAPRCALAAGPRRGADRGRRGARAARALAARARRGGHDPGRAAGRPRSTSSSPARCSITSRRPRWRP